MQLLNESLNGKAAPEPTGVKLNTESPVDSLVFSQDAGAIQSWLVAQLAERLGLEPECPEKRFHELAGRCGDRSPK